jgi:CrcB protein
MYRHLILVGAGSCFGGICRYLVQTSVHHKFPSSFPLGTFLVNVSGCLLIGLIYGIAEKGNLMTPDTRIFLATGLCGGYTTYSSFAFENLSLLGNGEWFYFSLYLGLSIILGIAATWLGTLVRYM